MIRAPQTLVVAYLVALVCFLALDSCWLTLMGPRLYQPQLGGLLAPTVDWTAAALFYVLYLAGLMAFAVVPALAARRSGLAVVRGSLFGLFAYATYDLTNQATLSGWPWSVTLADLVWGTIASGIAAGVAARFTYPPATREVGQ